LGASAAFGALTVILSAVSLCCMSRKCPAISALVFSCLAALCAVAAAGTFYSFANKLDNAIIAELTNKHLHYEW